MRVKEEFKKSGYFWLPSTPENKVLGTVSISDGGDIEVELVGDIEGERVFPIFKFERIIGYLENGGAVTLENCRCRNKTQSLCSGFSRALLHVDTVLIGNAYGENEIVSFNEFQFSVEGIDEWIGISGINVDYQFGEGQTSTIAYMPPTEINFNLNDGMKLGITFSWTLPAFHSLKEATISQKTYLKLTLETEHSLDDLIAIARKITTFLCFAIDKTVSINHMTALSENVQHNFSAERTVSIPIKIYSSTNPYSENEPKIDLHEMLFRYDDVKDKAETAINNWLKLYDEVEPALNLYFSTKTGGQKYIEGKFVALVQGLEAYHWRISTDKASLGKKIECLIKPFEDIFGDDDKRKEIVEGIKHTRNYLTHHEPARENKAAKGLDMWSLNLKMEAIFQLNFLSVLGFTEAEVKHISYKRALYDKLN
jgi:hypothetical protein